LGDVIEEGTGDGANQRVHLQSYFADGPYPNDEDSQLPDSVYYRVEPDLPLGGDTERIDFEALYPQESTLENKADFPTFDVGIPLTPFLSAGIAEIALGTAGGIAERKPEDYAYWDIDLDSGETFPTSQEESDGVGFDIVDNVSGDYTQHYMSSESDYT
jgi:hypothetical protein